MATNKGTLYSYNVDQTSGVSGSWDSAVGAQADLRRKHDFGERVAELAPEESPFFVYLSRVAKRPTTDPVFRFLENRSKIDWTSRNFQVDTTTFSNVSAGDNLASFRVDASGASVDWLIKGMVFAVESADGNATGSAAQDDGPGQILCRVESTPVDGGAYSTFNAKVISVAGTNHSSDADNVANNAECQVIGTAFGEGSGSPDVWSSQLDDDFGYTQIFKTAAEMTNTAIATTYRGYADEWNRIWSLKLREHKVDIERAMLFSQRARQSSIQYSEGLVGHILANLGDVSTTAGGGSHVNGTTAIGYTAGSPYCRTVTSAQLTYDQLLSDFEVYFDPARGGSSNKLALASLPVISYFNKMAGFADKTMALAADNSARYNFNATQRNGTFGHSIMQVDTIHGALSLVKEPLFRGVSSGFLLLADMSQLAYRPLAGNGLNRDTHIITNVQQADEDLRKDMIITEAGLEVTLPETHMLYNFSDL